MTVFAGAGIMQHASAFQGLVTDYVVCALKPCHICAILIVHLSLHEPEHIKCLSRD
jgi:deoxycytidylate deaminase